MDKKRHSVSLSFILLRFGFVMMTCMLACWVIWCAVLSFLESRQIVCPGHVGNQQVEQLLQSSPDAFQKPSDDFLGEYALFDKNGNLIVSNVQEKARNALLKKAGQNSTGTVQHTYADGSRAVFGWHFRKEFADPVLRASLPPFEYLWWATLGMACVLCWLLNALWLRRRLVAKLRLFRDVSEKVGAQQLDFLMPHAGIKEFDQALDAMEQMRTALDASLCSQWAAQQQRDAEMAALAHDLKTPITLIGGNAELLLEEDLKDEHKQMVETILQSNDRAKQYVSSLLEASRGEDEPLEDTALQAFFAELCRNMQPLAQAKKVKLEPLEQLSGCVRMQKSHLLRAMGNVVQNAVEYTPKGGTVALEGTMTEDGWQVAVRDEGPGFDKAAILHGTERLWRGDSARAATGHHGLGLWFASQVVQDHAGQLKLQNSGQGGVVVMRFYGKPMKK